MSAESARGHDGIRVVLRVTPKGGQNALDGWRRDASGSRMLKVRLSAAPEDGKANAALVLLLAKEFGVPQNAVTILRGAKGRVKHVHIGGDGVRLSAHLQKIGESA